MELKAIFTLWQREVIRYLRDKSRLFSTIFQPLLFLVVFGTGFRKLAFEANLGVDFVWFMFPGIIAIAVMGVAFFSAISTVWDREFGFLREILVAPVSRSSIVLGKVFGGASIASLQAFLFLILAPFLKIKIAFSSLPLIVLTLVLIGLVVSSIGLFIASLMKTMESFSVLMQLLVFPMFFLSGAFFPLKMVPSWMMILAKFDPLTYGVDALRNILLAGQISQEAFHQVILFPLSLDLEVLFLFFFIFIILATFSFNKTD